MGRNLKLIQHSLKIVLLWKKKKFHTIPPQFHRSGGLWTPEMDGYAQLQLLMHRWFAQIDVVAPGGSSEVAKAERAWLKSVQFKK